MLQGVALDLPYFVVSISNACKPSIPSRLRLENFKFEDAALIAIAFTMALEIMASENVSNFFVVQVGSHYNMRTES